MQTTNTIKHWHSLSDSQIGFLVAGAGANGGSIKLHDNGWRRTKFQWTPDYSGQPVPEFLVLKITASSSASGSSDTSNQQRDLDKETVFASVDVAGNGQSLPVESTGSTDYWLISQGAMIAGPQKRAYASSKKLVRIPTNGQTVVQGPMITYSAQIDIAGGRTISQGGSYDEYLPGVSFVNFGYQAIVDNRLVQISSTPGPTYHKTLDATKPIGKYRDQILPTSYCDAVGDIAAGLQNERNPDGSIVVDRAAVWDPIVSQWMGQGYYQANATNFTSPTYSWLWSGGTPIGAIADQISNGEVELNATPNLLFGTGVQLGGNRSGTGMSGNTVLTLKVTDSDGAIGQNGMLIKWHLPLEEIDTNGITDQGENKNYNASSWGSPLQRSVQIDSQDPAAVWWDIAEVGTGLAAIGTAVVFPEAAIAQVAVVGLEGANFTITNARPDSTIPSPISFSYPEYADAVIKQYNKNHGLPATQNDANTVYGVNSSGIVLSQKVDLMYSTLQLDANGNGDAGNAGSDINYANLIYQSRFALVRKWKTEQWRGYEYDTHGFKRYLPYPITQEYQMLYIPQVMVP